MLNARTIKKWLLDNVPSADATAIIRQHMVAVRYLPTHYVCTLPLFHSCITDYRYCDIGLITIVQLFCQLCDSQGCCIRNQCWQCVRFLGLGRRPILRLLCSGGVAAVSTVRLPHSGAVSQWGPRHGHGEISYLVNQYMHLLNNTVSFETFYLFSQHFFEAPLRGNLPVLLGLIGIWNSSFLGYNSRAILPCSNSNYICFLYYLKHTV